MNREQALAWGQDTGGLRIVDLTQPVWAGTPMWPASRAPRAVDEATIAAHGFLSRRVTLSEHTGTHLDAPSHFVAGATDPAGIPVERLVVPAVVIDGPGEPDAALSSAQVLADEAVNGVVPRGCAVLVRTGWDRHLAHPERYIGAMDFPGVSVEAARLLVERGVAGIGIDTLGVDPGFAADFPVHTHVTLPAGVWHLEGLVGLHRLPSRGALLFAGVLPLAGGSGAPARVVAVLPGG